MIILGIDPGSTSMGFAVLESRKERLTVIEYGTTKIKAKNLPDKLTEIRREVVALLKRRTPDIAGVESLFFAKNKKTALEVAQARGVIVISLVEANVPIVEFTPPQVKIAVANYGLADKEMVRKMVCSILGLKTLKGDDNAADALAIAIAASRPKSY